MDRSLRHHKPVAILLGPSRKAISGVTTHVNLMLDSDLAQDYALLHFQVGSEGRTETPRGRWRRLLTSPLGLALRILVSGADLVHINTSINRRAWWRDIAYLLAAKLCGARVVFQVHGGLLPRQFARTRHLPQGLMRRLLGLPDAIVVLAHSELVAYRDFVPGQNVHAVPNAIDVAPFKARMRPLRPPSAPLQLLFVGRLSPEKGLTEMIEGLALARGRGASAELVVAGGGPEEGKLKALAARLHVADAVRFVGPVFGETKRALLEDADLIVLPSHYEGLPYSLLEGMAAGAPVLATRVGAIPDVITEGVHGLFVPIRDPRAIASALLRLARNRSLLALMGLASQRRVAQAYSIERLTDDFVNLYRSLIGERPADALTGA